MRRLLPLLLFFGFSAFTYAQPGVIRGKVVDAAGGSPIEFATVVIIKAGDSSIVNGASSNADGSLVVDNLPFGTYIARVQFLGYKAAEFPNITLTPEKPVHGLGQVKLQSESVEVDEVVLEGERPLIQNSIDKKVFNISKSLVSEGGSATDALEQVPSVTVDVDGKVALRGSENVTILIDGKPSTLTGGERGATLDHIPASAIDRVEVITNPSAKYNPEGVSGIINIVTKKSRAPGYNGQVNATLGTGNKFNGSASLNYNVGKVNIFGNYSYRHNEMWNRGTSLRRNSYSDTVSYLDQVSDGNNFMNSHTLRAGIDYYINDKNTLSASTTMNGNSRNRFEEINYRNLDAEKFAVRTFSRDNYEPSVEYSIDGGLSYRRTFEKQGKELSLSGNYSSEWDWDSLFAVWQNSPEGRPAERTFTFDNNYLITIQGDYVLPLPKESKLETGFMGTFRNVDRDFTAQNLDGEFWLHDFRRSNHFVYDENVLAAYGTYANQFRGFGYLLSLRAEQTFTAAYQEIGDTTVHNNYFSIFPGLHLSRKLNDKNELQLSYSRRISRPGMWSLNPFIDYGDPFNLRTGNPLLQPEYIDSYEFGHMYQDNKTTLVSSIYYRYTHDKIVHTRSIDTVTGVTIAKMDNASNASAAGLELVANNTWAPWLSTTSSVNVFRNELQGSIEDEEYSRSNITVNAKLMSNFRLRKKMDAQLSYNYRGPMVAPQGVMRPMHSMDLGIRINVLKNKGSINLTLNDVLNTRRFSVYGSGQGFDVDFMRRRESRILYAGFTYRFGNDRYQPKNQKKQQQRQENGGDMEEMF